MKLNCSVPGCRYPATTIFNGNALCAAHLEAEYRALMEAQEAQNKEEEKDPIIPVKDSIGKKHPLRPKKK